MHSATHSRLHLYMTNSFRQKKWSCVGVLVVFWGGGVITKTACYTGSVCVYSAWHLLTALLLTRHSFEQPHRALRCTVNTPVGSLNLWLWYKCMYNYSYSYGDVFFSWLLRDKNMKLRTTYPGFTEAVDSFFHHLMKRVVPYQVGWLTSLRLCGLHFKCNLCFIQSYHPMRWTLWIYVHLTF